MPPRKRKALSEVDPNQEAGNVSSEQHNLKANAVTEETSKANNSKKRKSNSTEDSKPKRPKSSTTAPSSLPSDGDIQTITLAGEDDDTVPVYDTCDMIRKRITSLFKKHPKETNVSLAKRISAAVPHSEITAKVLGRFRNKAGYDKGNTCQSFYLAYVYFEKVRLFQGVEKSEDRLHMEKLWGKSGFNRRTESHNKKNLPFWMLNRPSKPNRFGEVDFYSFSGKPSHGVM
ncbi:hypothetical protein BT63DRAFT_427321 [Microthyrium microscopicum]|uniref:DUF7726 domain-containing protein n=1 Tax=Microthyrium microscopicum TaxID=703497 RepID=A0A6A6U3P6_9PEZI|nr:hypothetical protein BT63DRAFT_427321 [Microthyrium microscopicum]